MLKMPFQKLDGLCRVNIYRYEVKAMIVYILVILMLIYESVIDIKKKYIHIWPVVAAGIMGAMLNVGIYGAKVSDIIGGAAVGGVLLLMAFISHQQIGYGDAVVFLVLGVCLGPVRVLWVLWISMLAAGIVGIVGILRKKHGWRSQLSYIPFVTAGYFVLLPFICQI